MTGPGTTQATRASSNQSPGRRGAEAARPTAAHGPQADILRLQRAAGNGAVSRLLQSERSDSPASRPGVPAEVQAGLTSGGQPLDLTTRTFMETRFGHDFSGVRVHTDAQATESAQAVSARAYTVGRDIVFGAGHYTPETAQGQRLLAHELTHVIQQARTINAAKLEA